MADPKSVEEPKTETYVYPSLPLSENEEAEAEEEEEVKEKDSDTKDTGKPLLEEETVKIEIYPDKEGEDTQTLPLPDKRKEIPKAKLSKYLFPFTRIKEAWSNSSNIFQFLGRATCIIFQTVGWFTCVGGIPFLSLVMLVIGSIYVHDCNIEPMIPVYLIVSGVFGTIQHFLTIWIKKVPKETEGRPKVYRSYCRVINGILHLFLMIWFILGCVWVYGSSSEVVFENTERDEYCHKTLFNFSFWMLNLSFMLLGLLLFLTMCFFICIIATDN